MILSGLSMIAVLKKLFLILPLCTIILSGCASDDSVDQYGNTNYNGNKAGIGTIAGVLGGAYVGSKFGGGSTGGALVGGLLGAAAGGFIGNQIGAKLDNRARAKMQQTTNYAINSGNLGQQYYWESDQYSGYVTPTREYKRYDNYNHSQTYCREYTQTVRIGGELNKAYGTACRQPDGSWKVMQN